MKLGMILMSFLAVACLVACDDSTGPEPTDSTLRGQVVNTLGEPVAGATVVLQYEVDPPIGSAFDKPATTIQFDLPETGPVTLWISSFCDGDTVRMILDGELPPGQHAVVWDGEDDAGRTMPDGVYWYHVVWADGENTQPMILLHLGYGDLAEDAVLAPLVVTDTQGRFALSQTCLPLDFVHEALDEEGEHLTTYTVTRSVRVWAYDPQSGILAVSPGVSVDPETGAAVTVTVGD